jgi:membrane-associated phospholipid phosphatase
MPASSRGIGAFAAVVSLSTLLPAGRARAADPVVVEWSSDWPRARAWEVVDVVALTVASYEINSQWPTPTTARWRGGILFDDRARKALRGGTASMQLTFSDMGDYLYKGAVLAPYIVDNYLAALSIHQSLDVAVQMTLIDMQSLGLAGVLTLTAERTIPRERPFPESCGTDGDVRDAFGNISETCGHGDDYKSFYSGHAAATATMAGLTCVHHQHLPLYGGGLADLVPCVFMIGVATVTGITRIVADRHWASDVMVGWAVGAAAGYVLPSLLHYGFGNGRPLGTLTIAGISMMPLPAPLPNGAGAGVVAIF